MDEIEIPCEPGLTVGWAVVVTEHPADSGEPVVTRHVAWSTLAIEEMISDTLRERGDAVARIVHAFCGRDLHLRDGGRVEFRWDCHISDWRCMDCGVDTRAIEEYYMLHDHVWREANPDIEGILCVGCVEQRLGRKLAAADFTDKKINVTARHSGSARLTDRLQRSCRSS